jgi:hypothetical protein
MAHEALPKIHKSILLIGATGKIRTATFQQREHLVVPTVALVEGVIWPVNAEHPELVLFEEFTRGLQGWNGRPVVYGHPMLQGEAVSANDPKILEGWCFGQTFNVSANSNKKSLEMESWIDPARAQIIGAQELIDRLNAGKPIEISVGVFTKEQELSGEYNGQKYGGIWREPTPDHLAYLPDGQIGACSNEMGCGAPRVARTHLVTNRGFVSLSRTEVPIVSVETKKEEAKPKKPTLSSRMWKGIQDAMIRLRANEGETMSELFGMVSDALFAQEPGFMWLDDIKPDEGLAIYWVRPEDRDMMFQRKFTVDNGKVTLDAERIEVEWTRELKPVAAASASQPTTASSCSCGGAKHAEQNTKDNDAMKTKAERITALVDGKKLPGVTKEFLETCNETQLATLEADAAKVTTPESTSTTSTTPTTASATEKSTKESVEEVLKKMTEDDFLACAPKSIRDLVANQRTAETNERATLVAAMKTSQTEFTEDELKAMPIEQLRKFSRVCNVRVPAVDFTGRGIPRDDDTSGDESAPPKAIDMTARIKASRAAVAK